MFFSVYAESSIQSVKPTNVLGTSDQHASFSFIRPGLIQTAFAFNGPNSHQSFSSNIGNLQLAQRVLPNIANALAYKNSGLGLYYLQKYFISLKNIIDSYIYYTGVFPIAHGYATTPTFVSSAPTSLPSQASVDPVNILAYYQQLQQFQQPHIHSYSPANAYQTQLAQLFSLRQAQSQTQSQENVQATQSHTQVKTAYKSYLKLHVI